MKKIYYSNKKKTLLDGTKILEKHTKILVAITEALRLPRRPSHTLDVVIQMGGWVNER
jgi:hypothetical protein